MNKMLHELIKVIRFTEKISARIHGVLDEASIYKIVKEQFARSKHYTGSILLLTEDGSRLRIAETSLARKKWEMVDKVTGLKLSEYEIDLNKSSIYSQVIRKGRTVVAGVNDTIAELFPSRVARLISKILGYKNERSILTPLTRQGKIIGVLAMTCPDLVRHFTPSIRNLACHISNALDLAEERLDRERKVQEALKNSENLLWNIIEQSPFSTWISDVNGTNIRQNAACRKLFGIDYDEQTVGKYNMFSDVVIKERGLTEKLRKVFTEGETVRITLDYDFSKVKHVDVPRATHRVLDVTVFPIKDARGKVINAVVQHEDITERKKAEEERERFRAQLVHSAKMAGVGTLASGIAHEFNNLLQIMRGHAEFARKTGKGKDIEEALNIFLDISDKATKIIRDLLTFSRQGSSEKELCDITDPIESVLALTENQLKMNNIRIVRKYKKTPMIEIDKGEIQQVFLDMIINARDAMLPKGGKLEIRVKQNNENVVVSFSDTGKGIEEQNLGRVFEPFFTTKGPLGGGTIPGTGLGLYVSYGIIQRHKGSIEVKSRLGKGTTFTIKLPVEGVEPAERVVKDEKRDRVKKVSPVNILVIDDEEEICKILANWLSADGHIVRFVSSGEKAIELVRNEHFDVALLDIVMPGVPSLTVLEEIKKISPKTRVVTITGKLINDALLNELKEKGASECIQKPFKEEVIKEAISQSGEHLSPSEGEPGRSL